MTKVPFHRTLSTMLCCLTAAVLSGCAASSPWASSHTTAKPSVNTPAEAETVAATTPASTPAASPARQADAQQLREVMAELQRLGNLDPAARDQLTADLQNTDPALWPGILHQARAVAAYRQQQQAGGGMSTAYSGPTAPMQTGPPAPSQTVPPAPLQAGPPAPSQPGRPQVPAYAQAELPSPLRPAVPNGPYAAAAPGVQVVDRLPVSSNAALPPATAPGGPYPSTELQPLPTMAAMPPVMPNTADGAAPVDAGANAGDTTTDRPSADTSVPDDQAVPVSYETAQPLDWPGHVDSAIQILEKGKKNTPEDEIRLRMLYMAAGRYDDAVRSVPGLTPEQQAFWTTGLHGMGTLLNGEQNPDLLSRTAEAKQILSEATAKLGELAPLVVRNLAFCTRVHSYGCFETFGSYRFAPEQRVLLYAEVDNFASESTSRGYHTSLRSSYQLFDARGQRVAEQELASTEEFCQNRRHDFFIVYDFHLPKQIFPGKHTLRLTVEDIKGKKIGESAVDFEISTEKAKP